jgi:SAM-dependent methyltransferase
MTQRITEWIEITDDYHETQWENTYNSTIKFCAWLESLQILNLGDPNVKMILDVGAGAGANLYYMAQRYTNYLFKGIDLNANLITLGNKKLQENLVKNASLDEGDLYKIPIDYRNNFDGIVMFQTLSWLPEYKKPIKKMVSLNPKWIALTSLFYDGEVNCKIETQDYTRPLNNYPYKEAFYNIYAIRLVKELFEEYGYRKFIYVPFEIDIDIPKPSHSGMGTYTEKLQNGKRIQISGPLLMPWYFILATQ